MVKVNLVWKHLNLKYLIARLVDTSVQIKFPLSYYGIINRFLREDVKDVLDVACGMGICMFVLRNKGKLYRSYNVGVDIFLGYLKHCKSHRIHDDCVYCDVRYLPFKEKSFDAVLCLEIIEHLAKKDGVKLLKTVEKIAKKQVVVTTPTGFQHQGECHGNPYQTHRSGYSYEELTKLGFKVVCHTFKGVFGEKGLASYFPPWIRWVFIPLAYLFSPLAYLRPKYSNGMIGVKKLA
ncbi:MAG: class I SAM-dependent methyltransferase [Candidatus Bathyarchaeota archaeon]|nr:class I SAM-dependent methyltransferase [Candidatus Bathyarchaeota archaeon]